MPTIEFVPAAQSSAAALDQAVFDGDWWGAMYANVGSSDAFNAALNGTATATYDPSSVYTYTGLEVRYSTI